MNLGASVSGAGGEIELRLGSSNGTLIGRHVVQPTGSYNDILTQRVGLTSNVSGIHDLYLVFRNRNGVANIESFRFSTKELIRIMPLGDSITSSDPSHRSFRYYLWHELLEAGYGTDFVGSQIRNDFGSPPDFDFDQNHEGHVGWRTDEVLTRITAWMNVAHPDVVLIHLGTNDIWQGQSPASTARR